MLDYSQCPSLHLLKIKAKVFLDVRRNQNIWISRSFGLTEYAFLCCESIWRLVRIFILGFWCPFFVEFIFDLDSSFLMRGKAVFQCSFCFQFILIGKFDTWWYWLVSERVLCAVRFLPNFLVFFFVALWFPCARLYPERWSIQHEILGSIYLTLQLKCSSHNHNKLDFSHLLQ